MLYFSMTGEGSSTRGGVNVSTIRVIFHDTLTRNNKSRQLFDLIEELRLTNT